MLAFMHLKAGYFQPMSDSYLPMVTKAVDDSCMQLATHSSPAPRFTLQLPMRYRPVGQTQWRTAKTANVSSSGLLFLSNEKLAPGTKLEVEISMTSSMLKPTHLAAKSEVLRQKSSDETMMITTIHNLSSQTVEGDFQA